MNPAKGISYQLVLTRQQKSITLEAKPRVFSSVVLQAGDSIHLSIPAIEQRPRPLVIKQIDTDLLLQTADEQATLLLTGFYEQCVSGASCVLEISRGMSLPTGISDNAESCAPVRFTADKAPALVLSASEWLVAKDGAGLDCIPQSAPESSLITAGAGVLSWTPNAVVTAETSAASSITSKSVLAPPATVSTNPVISASAESATTSGAGTMAPSASTLPNTLASGSTGLASSEVGSGTGVLAVPNPSAVAAIPDSISSISANVSVPASSASGTVSGIETALAGSGSGAGAGTVTAASTTVTASVANAGIVTTAAASTTSTVAAVASSASGLGAIATGALAAGAVSGAGGGGGSAHSDGPSSGSPSTPPPVNTRASITAISPDSGTAGDFITNQTHLSLSGSSDPLLATQVVQLSSDGGQSWHNAVSSGVGATSWSFDDSATAHTSTLTYQVRVIDGNAQTGPVSSQQVVIDTSAPQPTLAIAAGQDALLAFGESSLDLVVSAAGLQASDLVTLFKDGSALGASHTVTAQEASNGQLSWQVLRSALGADGVKALSVSATDSAANVGSSNTLNITLDSTPPPVTTHASITAISPDSGAPGDFITNQTHLSLSGSSDPLLATQVVQLSSDGGQSWHNAVSSGVGATSWSFDDSATAHTSTLTYQVRVIDGSAQSGPVSSQQVVIDTSAPQPTLAIAAGQDALLAANETALDLVVGYGGMQAGDVITLFNDGTALGASRAVTALEASNGQLSWQVLRSALGADGVKALSVRATDLAANVGSSMLSVKLDSSFNQIAPSNSIQIAENSQISTELGKIIGSAPGHETFALSNDSLGTFSADPVTGIISTAKSLDFETQASHTITVSITPDIGPQTTFDYVINVLDVPEQTVTIAVITPDTNLDTDFITTAAKITVWGYSDPLAPTDWIQVSTDGGVHWVNATPTDEYLGQLATNATWTFDDPELHTGPYSISARVINNNGFVGPVSNQTVTVLAPQGFTLVGPGSPYLNRTNVFSVGDVNGDGLPDIGYTNWLDTGNFDSANEPLRNGSSFGIISSTSGSSGPVQLSTVPSAQNLAIAVNQTVPENSRPSAIWGLGDVNADGYMDFLTSIVVTNPTTGIQDAAYVLVIGPNASSGSVAANADGVQLTHFATKTLSASSIGDFNGDGIDDFALGEIGAWPPDANHKGLSYIVFGQRGISSVDADQLVQMQHGLTILNPPPTLYVESQDSGLVRGAGDTNGDGLADLILYSDHRSAAYLVLGTNSGNNIDLSQIAIGSGGYKIYDSQWVHTTFTGAAAVGDVNGDGLSDYLLTDKNWGIGSGITYCVFGKSDTAPVDVAAIRSSGIGGFAFSIGYTYSLTSSSAVGVGDVNGDGFADFMVSAAGGEYWAVIFGRSETHPLDSNVGIGSAGGGFFIHRPNDPPFYGIISGSALGDINGDGLADMLFTTDASAVFLPSPGSATSYVVFGKTDTQTVELENLNLPSRAVAPIDLVGTSSDDLLVGSNHSESFVGGQGNDTLTGNGGSDVMYGGAGDDRLVIDASNLASLSTGPVSGHLGRLDGGVGTDTLVLDGAGLNLDFSAIANAGAGSSRVQSIEEIDLTGSGNNSMNIAIGDVLDMSEMNLFNDASGWTGLGASVGRHQLVVDGDAGDVVNATGGWTATGTAVYNGTTYDVFNATNSLAQLLIDAHITHHVI